jgi:hypothetical protein
MKVPGTDYLGRENRIEQVELIGVTASAVTPLYQGAPGAAEAFRVVVDVPAGGIVLRARGRRAAADGPPLEFYTNPIRITTTAR